MKITIISNLYHPYVRGGAEIVARTMAEGLRAQLQHVSVITTQPFEGLRSLMPSSGTVNDVPAYRFYPINIYFYLLDFKFPSVVRALWHIIDIFNVHSAWVVYTLLKRERPDVVITHNLMGIGFLIPRVIALLRIRHVHVIHDVQLVNPSGIIIVGREKNPLQLIMTMMGYSRFMRWLFKKTSLIISPSQFLLTFYERYGFFVHAEKKVLPNPVAPHDTAPTNATSDILRLVYLGTISEPKGIVQLVRLVHDLPLDVQLRLNVIGVGTELKSLMDSVATDTRIVFYGWRVRDEIMNIFSESDMLIAPTICYDNSPTVVYEGLSYGLPALVTDAGGAQEIVHDGYNGFVVPAKNWLALRERIIDLARHPEQLVPLAHNAAPSVAGLSVDAYVTRLLTMLETETGEHLNR